MFGVFKLGFYAPKFHSHPLPLPNRRSRAALLYSRYLMCLRVSSSILESLGTNPISLISHPLSFSKSPLAYTRYNFGVLHYTGLIGRR
ncbi:hypothetical protein HanIR_Chr16g0819671 [Helianthus annuus]|nr:hypothetical protein HanIR_Chr16g0819671 [Helianthus annuus]